MIVAGLGFNSRATAQSLLSAYRTARTRYSTSTDLPGEVTHLATLADKTTSAVLREVASHLDLPILAVNSVEDVATPTDSPRIEAGYRTGSIAEATALVAAGSDARICCGRQISEDGNATCAIASGGVT